MSDEDLSTGERSLCGYPTLVSSYMTEGTKLYNRSVYDTWDNLGDYLLVDFSTLDKLAGLTIDTTTLINQAPYFIAFMTVNGDRVPTATYVAFLKNGDLVRDASGVPVLEEFAGQQMAQFLDDHYRYKESFNGMVPAIPLGFVTYSVEDDLKRAKNIVLHHYASGSVQNPIKAFVVDYIQVNTGYDTLSKCYDYDNATAASDATNTILRFQTVTEYPGCSSAASQQNGYTVSHFYNGLSSEALNLLSSREAEEYYTVLDGMLLAKEQYDAAEQLVSASQTLWTVVTEVATDANDTTHRKLYGCIPQVYKTVNTSDGVSTETEQEYSKASGNPTTITSQYYGSTGELIFDRSVTTYAYEKYPGMWQQNLLKAIAQTTTESSKNDSSSYTVQSMQVQTYQQWGETMYWADREKYVATLAEASPFTEWEGNPTTTDWLKTSAILNRGPQGGVIEAANANNIKSSTIYDDQALLILASFNNATVSENGVSYTSFEAYQTTGWVLSSGSGNIIDTDSFTGKQCFEITTTGELTKAITLIQLNRSYLFAGWFKTPRAASSDNLNITLVLTDSNGSGNQVTKDVTLTMGEWKYVQWIVNPVGADMTGSQFQLGIQTVIEVTGIYLRVDDIFWMPVDSTFSANTYDEELLMKTAMLGPNGLCNRIIYDLFHNPIGQTDSNDNPLGFSAALMTRQTTEMCDGANPFPTDTPNMGLSIDARGQGFYDQFKADALDHYTFLNSVADDWQVSDGQLKFIGASSHAPLGAQIQRQDFQADSFAVYITLETDNSNTVSISTGQLYVLWNGNNRCWQLGEDRGETVHVLEEVAEIGFS